MLNDKKREKYCNYFTRNYHLRYVERNSDGPVFATREGMEQWYKENHGEDCKQTIDSLLETSKKGKAVEFQLKFNPDGRGRGAGEYAISVTFETEMTARQRKKVDMNDKRRQEWDRKLQKKEEKEERALLAKLQKKYKK